MKIAITGGSGFVGSAIYKECLGRGHEVILLDRSKFLSPDFKVFTI